MSNQARLLLLSGTAGSGTTSTCAVTAQALADEGVKATVVDPYGSEDVVAARVGALLLGVPGDLPPQWWGSGTPVPLLAAWRRIAEATERSETVVVDLGDLGRSLAMMDFLDAGRRLLSAALTPDLASISTDVDSPFAILTDARDQLSGIAALVRSDETRMRLVCQPRDDDADRVLSAAASLAMLGVDVDGIVVNRCARKSEGSASMLREQRQVLETIERRAAGPSVWKGTDGPRAVPKGRSALGPLGGSTVLREDTFSLDANDEGYVLHVPLAGVARAQARVGRHGDALVVEFGGVTRWILLPSVLRRCLAVEAERGADGLHVTFVPDPGQWRDDSGGAR